MNQDKQYANGFRLMRFEAACYFELTKHIVSILKQNEEKPCYGCQNGRNTFIVLGYQLDAAVFVYEYVKHVALCYPEAASDFLQLPEYTNLEKVRNNIHTYFKKGNYANKSETIVNHKLAKYKMDEPDFLYSLRNDLSLVFQISGHSRELIGSDYFIGHCIFETNREWTGEDYKEFGQFLASTIKSLGASVAETEFRLNSLSIPSSMPQIELFDYKSPALYKDSPVSSVIAFRLLLMLYQISYGLLLIEKLITSESVADDELWLCFLTKILAMKYDESFDNLTSMLRYASANDVSQINAVLQKNGLSTGALRARSFARDLRNTIHYQEISLNEDLVEGNTPRELIVATYLTNAGVDTVQEFIEYKENMIAEMKTLQAVIREIMNVDKEYQY